MKTTPVVRSPARPGPGRPRRGEEAARNRALLQAALDLFLDKGFDGATLNEIMARAGMAKKTLLQSYPSKSDLFRAAMELAVADWIIPREVLEAAETEDREVSLLRAAEMLTTNVTSPKGLGLMRMTNAESFRHPEAVSYALESGTLYAVDYLADLLRRRFAKDGEFAEAETYATSLMSMLVAPARLRAWGAQVDDEAVQRHIRHCVALFLRGILHRRET